MTSEELRLNKLELLGKLVAGLGHEIRNPLSAVKLNLDYMEMFSDELAPDIQESISASKESIERIQHLIETTLSFARVKNDEDKQPVEKIIADSIDLSVIRARSKDIKIIPSISADAGYVQFQPTKILQILLNLISNALDACEKGCVVSVGADLIDEDKIALYVEDNGPGIPEENRELIFDEFFTTKKEGNGIGLYVCKELTESLNGKIYLESQLGKGSKFIMEFKLGEEG